jgi:NTP pyrophosphatase (non-canonical NTP hydrolase)
MSENRETQATIGRWARETFPGGDDLSPRFTIRLLEEVVELCLAAGATPREIVTTANVTRYDQRAFERMPEHGNVPEEMADCAIALAAVAGRRGVDLQAEIDKKMAVNRRRTWRANGDGTGYHVKEGESSQGS